MSDPIRQTPTAPQVLDIAGKRIAYHSTPGGEPGVVFFGGFMSDMAGTKATALEAWCRRRGRGFVRFDYTGHGRSSGTFTDGTIGGWVEDAAAVLDHLTRGPQVIVGSSMGGWIMVLAALMRPRRVAGLVGIAAAPDFTEDLISAGMTAEQRAALERDGLYYLPDEAGNPCYPFTRALIEDGRKHLVLRGKIPISCPVALVHGMLDQDVPFETSLTLAKALASDDVTITLVKDGTHTMSEPKHLPYIFAALESVLEKVGPHGAARSARKPA